jgi:PhnB protein
MPFTPYLFFNGKCADAFTRYHEIFGGDLFMLKNSDAPDGGMEGADPDMIIHAAVTLEGGAFLMGSDDPTSDGGPMKGISVSFNHADVAEVRRVYDALSQGGEQTQPLMETFFSPAFGMCVDTFGVPWMVSADAPQQ